MGHPLRPPKFSDTAWWTMVRAAGRAQDSHTALQPHPSLMMLKCSQFGLKGATSQALNQSVNVPEVKPGTGPVSQSSVQLRCTTFFNF